MLEFLFNKVASPMVFFHRKHAVAASGNNEQQQLFEGFVNSCYKIVPLILLQELINDFAVYKHSNGILLLVEVLETRTTYFKKEPHFLTDQPITWLIFMLRCIKFIFFN